MQERVDSGLQWFIDDIYAPVLKGLVRFRYITLSVFSIILLITAALCFFRTYSKCYGSPSKRLLFVCHLEFPPGTPFETVDHHVLRLTHIANEIRSELNIEFGIGSSNGVRDSFQHTISQIDENMGWVDIELAVDERVRSRVDDIKKRWQERSVRFLLMRRFLSRLSGHEISVCPRRFCKSD